MPESVQTVLNRGLCVEREPGLIEPGFCSFIKNMRFTKKSVRRRDGKRAAYQQNVTGSVASMLKRFYKLRTSGSVLGIFLKATADKIFKANSDWNDDSPTGGGIACTELTKPTTSNSSLRNGLSASSVTLDSGAARFAVQARSWAYIGTYAVAADDTNGLRNVPMRTDGDKIYLHGLMPPGAPTYVSDAAGTGPTGLATYRWRCTWIYGDGSLGESNLGDTLTNAVGGMGARDVTLRLVAASAAVLTSDVTTLRVWRQEANKAVTDPYFLVKEIAAATIGAYPFDFVDNTPDSALVQRPDTDVFMPPKYKCATMFGEFLAIGNLKCRDTDDTTQLDVENGGVHKGKIRFSHPGKPDIFHRFDFMEPSPDTDAGELKGLVWNPLLNALFAFFENDTVAIEGDSPRGQFGSAFRSRRVAQAKGTASPFSAVEYGGRIFHWTKKGLEVIEGYVARNITADTIRKMWGGLTSDSLAFDDRINIDKLDLVYGKAIQSKEEIWWVYCAGGSTFPNRVLVLDIRRWLDSGSADGAFSIFHWTVGLLEVWAGEGDREEVFGAESDAAARDWIYRLDFGDEDENGAGASTVKAPILQEYRTQIGDLGLPHRDKMFRMGRFEAKSGQSSAELRVDVDAGAFRSSLGTHEFSSLTAFWGVAVWDISDFNGPSVENKTLGLPRECVGVRIGYEISITDRLDGASAGPEPFELYSISTDFEVLRQRVRH